MRTLLLLRGSPGCGKTTWIEQNGLKQYALSADDIRMMCSSPSLNALGQYEISQANDTVVWSILFRLLEVRMQNGEFTVIDATNSKTSEMNRYKELCGAYKYRIFCVDFTDIPIDVAKERNRQREELKRVPEDVIDKIYSRFQTQKIPSGITVIKPDELDRVWMKMFDMSAYKRIHVIGDVHGCNTALQEYLGGELKHDEFYIFTGDYIDRGLESVEVVQFLLSIYEKPNVLLLEGNHERWLWTWANNCVGKSKEFELVTATQLDAAGMDKRHVRQLYRRMGQCAYFNYGGNVYLVTHAGLSRVPKNLTTVATSQMIKGCGAYKDSETVENAFAGNTPDNFYQIHGHRNTKDLPVYSGTRCFNLEGKVEFGGCLRCVDLLPDGTQETFEIKNTVFKEPEEISQPAAETMKTVGDAIMSLRQNRYVQEKKYGDISAFNFTKNAFYDKIWDEQTTKARGLFINVPQQRVVARAYDKFFNINERPETKFDMLQLKLQFPVTAYIKENGFLGIVSYDDANDDLFITTKSSPDGDFSTWLKEMLHEKLPQDTLDAMRVFAKENGVSFVFECVDMKHDPHIIEYPESQLFLLDIVYNDMQYRKMPYELLCEFANAHGIRHKEKAYVLETWQDFFDWYYTVTEDDWKYDGRYIEGFVLEDSAGYMVKLKLQYYNFWKFMRGIAHEAIRKGYIDRKRTAALTTPLANQFYAWVKTLHDEPNHEMIPKDICSLRKMFYKTEAGAAFASA